MGRQGTVLDPFKQNRMLHRIVSFDILCDRRVSMDLFAFVSALYCSQLICTYIPS